MKKYRNIIFDFDGTLIDSRRGVFNSLGYSLEKLGIHFNEIADPLRFIGPPLKRVFVDFFSMDESDAERAVAYYRDYYGERGVYECQLYDGIEGMLSRLLKDSRQMAIATTKASYYTEIIVRHLKIERYFARVTGSNLDGTLSDKGELIRHLLGSLEKKPEGEIVMVGDRKFDIIGAKENSIDSIGVTYGYGAVDEIEDADPDCTVESVAQLEEVLM